MHCFLKSVLPQKVQPVDMTEMYLSVEVRVAPILNINRSESFICIFETSCCHFVEVTKESFKCLCVFEIIFTICQYQIYTCRGLFHFTGT